MLGKIISAESDKFFYFLEYVRKCDKTNVVKLQQIYNKLAYIENKTKNKGGDFFKSPPNSCSYEKDKINTKTKIHHYYDNIRTSLKNSIKFGTTAKQLSLMIWLTEQFKYNPVLFKTVNEIADENKCERKLMLKFLKLLESEDVIKRKRGKVELVISIKKFSTIATGIC